MAEGLRTRIIRSVRTYRPERRRVVITSLVLLVLLRPLLVMGWLAFLSCAALFVFLVAGSNRFWRCLIAMHGFAGHRWPQTARRFRVNAFVFAKRWDRMMEYMPQGIADAMQTPDLRAIAGADARHDAAMSHRLDNLSGQEGSR